MSISGEQFGFLEKTILIIEKYGIWKIIQALLIIGVLVFVIYNASNMGTIVSQAVKHQMVSYDEQQNDEHTAAMDMRRDVNVKMPEILQGIMNKTNADRVFVMELHNGSNNTSGLPFTFGEVTYEVEAPGIHAIGDDYNSFVLSRYSFPLYLERNHMWYGSIEELFEIDAKLAHKLASNDVTYFAVARLNGISGVLGYMGISYCNNTIPAAETVLSKMVTADTQKVTSLLDMSAYGLLRE